MYACDCGFVSWGEVYREISDHCKTCRVLDTRQDLLSEGKLGEGETIDAM